MKIQVRGLRRLLAEVLNDEERHENVLCPACGADFDTRDYYGEEPEVVECPVCEYDCVNPNYSNTLGRFELELSKHHILKKTHV